jgi:siroheme synthase-like protein
MAFGYPVLLELAGRRTVVIGDFAIEAGKVEGLLVAGAEVTVIAKGPEAALARFSTDPRVTVHRRGYGGPADLSGAVLCVAHAAEPGVRDAIAADARAAGVLVNVMDDVPNCDFAAPAIVRRGDLVVAVGTGGRAPALASRLRAELGDRFGPEWTELVDLVGRVRTATLPNLPDFEDRSRRWKAALDLEELERLIAAGQGDLAATRLRDRLLQGLPGGSGQPSADLPGGSGQPSAPDLPEGRGQPSAPNLPGGSGQLAGGCGQPDPPLPALGYAPPPGDPASARVGAARSAASIGDPAPGRVGAARPAASTSAGAVSIGDPAPAGRVPARMADGGVPTRPQEGAA